MPAPLNPEAWPPAHGVQACAGRAQVSIVPPMRASGQHFAAPAARRAPRRLTVAALREAAARVAADGLGVRDPEPHLFLESVAPRRVWAAWRAANAPSACAPLVLRLWFWPAEGAPFHTDLPLAAAEGSRFVDVRLDAACAGQLGWLKADGSLRVAASADRVEPLPAGPSADLGLVVCDVRHPPACRSAPGRASANFPRVRFPRFGKRRAGRPAEPPGDPAPAARRGSIIEGRPANDESVGDAAPVACESGAGHDATAGGWPWPAGAASGDAG